MKDLNLNKHPHRRYNLLTGEWLLVSPHRANRPWQGQIEKQLREQRRVYDPECYLCPGNTRAGRKKNPPYTGTFVFENDFSALHLNTPSKELNVEELLLAKGEPGICRVICFSPRHDLTLAEMEIRHIREVIEVWIEQYRELGARPDIKYVQIFENKGEIMGCSNPHPHGQVWAQESIPVEPTKEMQQMKQYLIKHGKCLLCEYLSLELKIKDRIVLDDPQWVVLVPFWAIWPFETLILSRRHLTNFLELNPVEKNSLAGILKRLTIRYDNLFQISFPYSAGFHPSPTDGMQHPECHFHMHFYPPLLRSATIKKFMVGYEMLANPQRDITPEWSAQRLRHLAEVHYKLKE